MENMSFITVSSAEKSCVFLRGGLEATKVSKQEAEQDVFGKTGSVSAKTLTGQ